MKRKIIALTVSLMMAGSLVACGGNTGSKENNEEGKKETAEYAAPEKSDPNKWNFDEMQKVSYCKVLNVDEASQLLEGQTSADNDVHDYIREKYNIELEEAWTAGEVDYEQQLALHIASGDLPDLIYVNDYSLYKQLIDTQMVQPITEAFAKQCSDKLLAINEASGGEVLKTGSVDGELWGVPAGLDADQFDVLWLRKDWLEKLNMEEPKTLEELEEVLKAFTYNDPDGNGKQDTCGLAVNATNIITPQGVNYGLNQLFHNMGVYPDSWLLDEEGHVYNGSTDEKMKDALTVLNRWYTEGYIDQEFISRTGEGQVEGLISSGKVGAFYGQWWSIPRDQGVLDADWVPVAAPLNEKGKYSYMRTDTWSDCIMVNAECKNPEAAIAALAISVDIGMDVDHEGFQIACDANNGESNRNFYPYGVWTTGAGDMINITNAILEQIDTGSYTPYENIGEYDKLEIQRAAGFADGSERTPDAAWSYYGRALAYPLIKSGIGEGTTACWYWETESSPTINTILDSSFNETVLKIITGQAEVSEYDTFISQWHTLGGDTLISEIETELGIE